MPPMEGTPLLSIVVGDEERSELGVDLDAILREGAKRMLASALKSLRSRGVFAVGWADGLCRSRIRSDCQAASRTYSWI